MKCLYCDIKLTTANSRPQQKSNSTWRRRNCNACGAVFTSVESIDLSKTLVFERSAKHVEPFCRDKLFISIYEACKHRKDALAAAEGLTDTVISKLLPTISAAVVTRGDVHAITQRALKSFDHAAAVQYTAYHPIS